MTQHSVTLTVTTGRTGSSWLTDTFAGSFPASPWISHEFLSQKVVKPARHHRAYGKKEIAEVLEVPEILALFRKWEVLLEQGPVVDFGWTMSTLVPAAETFFGDRLRVLFLHRHPVDVAGSFTNVGNYSVFNSEDWALSPSSARVVHSSYQDRWRTMSPYEKGLFLWLEGISYGLEIPDRFPNTPYASVSCTELFSSNHALRELADFLGFGSSASLKPGTYRNEQCRWALEQRPVHREDLSKTLDYAEVVKAAVGLGYDMSPEAIERRGQRYMISGVGPHLRHYCRYWRLRELLGNWAERLGWRKRARPQSPRSIVS
jgi:hypothetical protein